VAVVVVVRQEPLAQAAVVAQAVIVLVRQFHY
jgi:hypothetical protein